MASKLGKIIADFRTSLAVKIAVGGETGTLQSATDDDSVALPTGHYFLTLDGDNSQKEHIACTLIGTALTAIKSVSRQGVQTTGCVREHRIGATVTITDFAHIKYINDLLDGTTDLDGSNPLAYDTQPTITDDKQLATKKYADDIAIAGGADASTSTKGITKLSTAPASATEPIAVGDNDTRLPTQDENNALAGTSGTPSTSNKYVTNDDTSATSSNNKVIRYGAAGLIKSSTTAASVAGDVVALDAGNKLPAVDGSQLTGIIRNFYQTVVYNNTSTDASGLATTLKTASSQDGQYMVATALPGSVYIYLLKKDSSGAYYIIATVSENITGGEGVSYLCPVIVGNYIYIISKRTLAGQIVDRYDLATLGNKTSTTIAGGSFHTATPLTAVSEGSNIYINVSSNVLDKYTLAANTITYSSSITFTSLGSDGGLVSDGSYFYSCENTAAPTLQTLRKYNFTGGSAVSTKSISIDNSGQQYEGTNRLVSLSSTELGIVKASSRQYSTTVTGNYFTIKPLATF